MIRFGPSGNAREFYEQGKKNSEEAPEWLAQRGLNAYEYSFGRGINISDKKANAIRDAAEKYDVAVSAHAPYYINFANPDDAMAEKSYDYVLRSCAKLSEMGGERVVFHPAAVGKAERCDAFALCRDRMKILRDRIYAAGMQKFRFCPETMGKINQIGSLEEIVELSSIDDIFLPAIDFGHLNARTMGSIKSVDDYRRILETIIKGAGFEKADKMHVHFSKIEYSKGGEVKHLTFEDQIYGPEFEPLAVAVCEFGLHPVFICESDDTQAADAVEMKNIFERIKKETI